MLVGCGPILPGRDPLRFADLRGTAFTPAERQLGRPLRERTMPHQPTPIDAPEIFSDSGLAVSPLHSAEQLPAVRHSLLAWRRRQPGLALGAVMADADVMRLIQSHRTALARDGINLVLAPGQAPLETEARAWLTAALQRARQDSDRLADSADDVSDPD